MKAPLLLAFVLGAVGATDAAAGSALRVPEDYPSILAAVDAAASGDSVLVGPGTWSDTDTRVVLVNGQSIPITAAAFLKPGVSVIGAEGPATTVVQTSSGTVLVHATPGSDTTRVTGLSITGTIGILGAVDAPLEVRSCRIVNNRNVGVECVDADVVLRDCLIEGNEWVSGGTQTGAVLGTRSSVELHGCTLRANTVRAIRVRYNPSRVVMDSCLVADHAPNGACLFETVYDLQIRNSWFVDNRATGVGGAVAAYENSIGTIEFCVFARDSAADAGGLVTDGRVLVGNNTFVACHATNASALGVVSSDYAGVANNIFAYSSGSDGAVFLGSGASHPTTGCNIFWANAGGDFTSFGTWTPAATDIFADPQFCDYLNDDFTLHSSSPGAPGTTPACGPIGALGVGCGSVSVERQSWGRVKGSFR